MDIPEDRYDYIVLKLIIIKPRLPKISDAFVIEYNSLFTICFR